MTEVSRLSDGEGFRVTGDFVDLDNFLTYTLVGGAGSGSLLTYRSEIENAEELLGEEYVVFLGGDPYIKIRITETGTMPVEDWNRLAALNSEVVRNADAGGLEISEEIARLRGLRQVQAGGEFEVDTDIDDFDDYLAAKNIRKAVFRKAESVDFEDSSGSDGEDGSSSSDEDSSETISSSVSSENLVMLGLLVGVYLWQRS